MMAVWSSCGRPGSARSRAGSPTCARGWVPTCSRRSRAPRARTGGSGSQRPGPPLFAEDRPIRRVHGDASMFVGGLRALLLQSLHPLAMAGVAGHSGYRGDPGAAARTSYFLAVTTFGATPMREETIARIRAVHERVRGRAPDGRAVLRRRSAPAGVGAHRRDRQLLRAHQRYGSRPLDQAGRDGYVADTARVARELGVIDPPETEAALADRIAAFDRSWSGRPRRAPRPGSCCSSRRSRSLPARLTRCWPRRRWNCSRGGRAGR